jgi:MFS family permease
MWLVGLAVFAAGLSTTLPLPLYVEYAGGGGTGMLAAAFACYAGILILTAPLLGPLPDRIGRRACVLIGLLLAGGSTLLLALWPGLGPLALARWLRCPGECCPPGKGAAWLWRGLPWRPRGFGCWMNLALGWTQPLSRGLAP